MTPPQHPPVFQRPLLQALRAVPAKGLLLELREEAVPSWAGVLREQRGDEVVSTDRSGAVAGRLPFPDRGFLTALSFLLPGLETAEERQELIAELCRLANRYTVLGSLHPVALAGRGAGRALRHPELEALLGAEGFRPLARAAAAPFLRPEWVYVFART